MANDKHLYELDELTTPQSNDLVMVEKSSNNKDMKVKLSNLISNDTIEAEVDAWLDDHPEATTTVEDGSITPAKLHQDTLDMFDEKANTDGYYDEMSVGSAEQLLSNTYIPDNDPYLFRPTAGSKEVGDRIYEDAIVGASMAHSQLIRATTTTNFAYEACTATSGGDNKIVVTYSGSGSQSVYQTALANAFTIESGHKVLAVATIKPNADVTRFYYKFEDYNNVGTPFNSSYISASANTEKQMAAIVNFATRFTRLRYKLFLSEATTTTEVSNIMLFDLTIRFGSTIADYAYSLEQTEVGSGFAWLKSQGFFTKDYYAYDAGSIKSVQTSAKKVVGFNQWDEQWENGTIDESTGENTASSTKIRSKNYIGVIPNTTYYFKCTDSCIGFRYNSNKQYLGSFNLSANSTFTVPDNAYYLRFRTPNSYGTTYKNDICLNFHWDGERDGEYEPYVEHTYPLDSDLELRGIPKLVDGKIKYDGDTYASDGSVTRKYGIIELNSNLVTWSYKGSLRTGLFQGNISGMKVTSALVCSRYPTGASSNTSTSFNNWGDKTIHKWTGEASRIYIVDESYSDATTFKNSLSGVYLVYELATTTTESADPYQKYQKVDNWGTEEFIDTRNVPVPVGHNSRYLPDLKAKLESAPNNPSTNGKYFLQYENGQATYVPVPSEVPQTPSEDGTYILKATVSSGTATLAWVAES